ncbi:unnamed protein product [Cylicocyclus nassatus]|uniref:Uncharacterized protein n=1 Tax=Cylicocyclus nassatus TaxID=53992 RepID=A0AA36GP92_CYLNA|nr:unnamed protein product [Cylicocyclus nassatus]
MMTSLRGCALCFELRPPYSVRMIPSKHSWRAIMLSSLFRHGFITIEKARQVYEEVKKDARTRLFCCDNHLIDLAALLETEVEQLGGEFSIVLNVLSPDVLSKFISVLQSSVTLLDEEMQLEADDAMSFYYDCLRRFESKVYQRLRKWKRKSVQDNGTIEPLLKRSNLLPSSSEVAPISPKNFNCPLCGELRADSEMRDSWKNRKQNPILLSCLLTNNSVGIKLAQNVYRDILLHRRRFCKEHYIQAALIIGNAIKEKTGNFPLHGLDCIAMGLWQDFFERVKNVGALIDNKLVIQVIDVINFFSDCLVIFRDTNQWEAFFEANKTGGNSSAGTSSPLLWANKVKDECFTGASTSPSPSVDGIHQQNASICKEEEMETSAIDVLLNSSHDLALDKTYECGLCNNCSDPRAMFDRADMNLIFLSCLLMDDSIDGDSAKVTLSGITCGKEVLACKQHYALAVEVMRREVESLAKSSCKPDLSDVPETVWTDLLVKLWTYAVQIDDSVVVNLAALKKFYHECVAKSEVRLYVEEEASQSTREYEVANFSLTKSAPTCSNDQFDREKPPNFCGDFYNNENRTDRLENCIMQGTRLSRNRGCYLCGLVCAEDESRWGSMNPRQNLVFMSCLISCGIIKAEVAKELFQRLGSGRKRLCKQHYIQAASWIGQQVEKNWGRFPENGLFAMPREMLSAVMEQIQGCVTLLGEDEVLNFEELARFYDDCLAKYRHRSGWNEKISQDMEITTLERTQKSVPEAASKSAEFVPKESVVKEAKGAEILTCSLCDKAQPSKEMRSTSFSRASNALLLCSLVLKGALDLNVATNLYEQFSLNKEILCKKHYLDAELRGDESQNPDTSTPVMELLSRLQSISNALDKTLTLRTYDLNEFVSTCRRGEKVLAHLIKQTLQASSTQNSSSSMQTTAETLIAHAESHQNSSSGESQASAGSSEDPSAISKLQDSSSVFCCALCGVSVQKRDLCTTSPSYASFWSCYAFVVYCVLKFNVINVNRARLFYKDVSQKRLRICRKHLLDSANYISDYLKSTWDDLSLREHIDVPPEALNYLWEDMQIHLGKIGETAPSNYDDVAYFLEFCLTLLHMDEENMEASEEKDEIIDEDAIDADEPSDQVSAEDLLNNSNLENGVQKRLMTKTLCTICGNRCFLHEMRRSSRKLSHVVVLLSCIYAQDVDLYLTRRKRYAQQGLVPKYMCEDHYIQAAKYIGKEVETVNGAFPQNGLARTSEHVMEKFLENARIFKEKCGIEVELTRDSVVEFFDDCLSKYYRNHGWKKPEKSVEEANNVSADLPEGDSAVGSAVRSFENVSEHAEEISAADLLGQSSQNDEEWECAKASCSRTDPLQESFQESEQVDDILETNGNVATTSSGLAEEERLKRIMFCAALLQRNSKGSFLNRLVIFEERWLVHDSSKRTAVCVDKKDLPNFEDVNLQKRRSSNDF